MTHRAAQADPRLSAHRAFAAGPTSGNPLSCAEEASSEVRLRAQTRGAEGVAEIHLEELGQHSWLRAMVNNLTGSDGSAQFRFVARLAGLPDVPASHVATGATFPVMRFADLSDEMAPNTWSGLAHQRLGELDAELVRQGWRRRPEPGRHWWSLRYHKPIADPTSGDGYGGEE